MVWNAFVCTREHNPKNRPSVVRNEGQQKIVESEREQGTARVEPMTRRTTREVEQIRRWGEGTRRIDDSSLLPVSDERRPGIVETREEQDAGYRTQSSEQVSSGWAGRSLVVTQSHRHPTCRTPLQINPGENQTRCLPLSHSQHTNHDAVSSRTRPNPRAVPQADRRRISSAG